MVGVPQAAQGGSTGGEGVNGAAEERKVCSCGAASRGLGKRGWAQLASMSSSSGTGRDALPAMCQRDPDTPRACARPAGFFPSTVFGGCRAAGYRSTGLRMRCPHPVASWMPWKGEAGEVPPVGLRPAVLEEKAPGPGGRRNLWLFLAWLAARRQVGAAGLHHSPRAACRASAVCCANRSPAAGGLRGWLQSPGTRVPGCVCGSCPSTVTTGCQSARPGRADTTNRAAPTAQTSPLWAPVVLNPQSLCRAQSCALPASKEPQGLEDTQAWPRSVPGEPRGFAPSPAFPPAVAGMRRPKEQCGTLRRCSP